MGFGGAKVVGVSLVRQVVQPLRARRPSYYPIPFQSMFCFNLRVRCAICIPVGSALTCSPARFLFDSFVKYTESQVRAANSRWGKQG